MTRPPILSVVDYTAWDKGYMPPSEHILIDKLAYRGARVIMSFAVAPEEQVWIVLEGPPLSAKKRKFTLQIMQIWLDIDTEDAYQQKPKYEIAARTLCELNNMDPDLEADLDDGKGLLPNWHREMKTAKAVVDSIS